MCAQSERPEFGTATLWPRAAAAPLKQARARFTKRNLTTARRRPVAYAYVITTHARRRTDCYTHGGASETDRLCASILFAPPPFQSIVKQRRLARTVLSVGGWRRRGRRPPRYARARTRARRIVYDDLRPPDAWAPSFLLLFVCSPQYRRRRGSSCTRVASLFLRRVVPPYAYYYYSGAPPYTVTAAGRLLVARARAPSVFILRRAYSVVFSPYINRLPSIIIL